MILLFLMSLSLLPTGGLALHGMILLYMPAQPHRIASNSAFVLLFAQGLPGSISSVVSLD